MPLFTKKKPLPKSVYDEAMPMPPSWVSTHLPTVFILIAVVLIAAVFIGMRFVMAGNSAVNRLISSSAKDLDSSVSFDLEADYNGEKVMTYHGTIFLDAANQSVQAVYDADYQDYTYRNVTYTKDDVTYSGTYYNGQWTVTDRTDKALDFFDFYTDYKKGTFDASSFLRFIDSTSRFSSVEFEDAVEKLLDKFSYNSPVSNLTVTKETDHTTYSFKPDLPLLFQTLKEESGPVFYKASEYDAFKQKIADNEKTISESSMQLDYNITNSGYLTDIKISLDEPETQYSLSCVLSDFGKMPEIPDDFFEAASIEK